ncbi:MAG: LysR family transcriptional regulator [Eggerthellaceae bacterium]|nr:LysR family transcriptional regulator [Eggerthellaceae bacterium]
MQVESLRYFIELARAGSFYGAAKSTFISQQGLNKAISSLESELGYKLVERSRRGVRLTSEGEVVLRYAKRIVGSYDLMVEDIVGRRLEEPEGDEPISLHVSYYAAQIASANPAYVSMLAERSSYIEEPFDKLIAHATNSDGTDLSFLDLHAHSISEVLANPNVLFEPIVKTRYGFVWKDGSSLSNEETLHRETLAKMPVALNAFREMRQLSERIFRDHPFENVRMEATSPRMLLEYVRSSDYDSVAAFDSFGFFLSQQDDDMPTDGLHFTPLSTPESVALVGFLYPRHVKLSLRAQHTVGVLKHFLADNCADYFISYPLD